MFLVYLFYIIWFLGILENAFYGITIYELCAFKISFCVYAQYHDIEQ